MAPVYNESQARLFYRYALASFCNQPALETWSCGSPCRDAPITYGSQRLLGPGPTFKAQGYAAQLPGNIAQASNQECVVAFRGTQPMNWNNVAADWMFIPRAWMPTWCHGCEVHAGFADAYEELRAFLLAAVVELNCSTVIFAGHSLGSAIATLASLDLRASQGINVTAVWTFGKPRVGNRAFVDQYIRAASGHGVQPPMWRIVHYHDIIPHLPPYELGMFYHESLEVFYDTEDNSHYVICPSTPVLFLENQSEWCMSQVPRTSCNMADHGMYMRVPWDFPSECGFGFDDSGIFQAKVSAGVCALIVLLCAGICAKRCRCFSSHSKTSGEVALGASSYEERPMVRRQGGGQAAEFGTAMEPLVGGKAQPK